MKAKYLILFWIIMVLNLKAPPNRLLFRHLSIEQGLSENSVYTIFQDHKGFMWFGTESGLNRYDGYGFKIYNPIEGDKQSLSNSFIYAITQDSAGNLWVGTDEGLNRLDSRSDTFTRFLTSAQDPGSLSGNKVYCIFEDKDKQIWVGTDKGVNLFIPEKNGFKQYRHDPQNMFSISHDEVRSIDQGSDGRLWMATLGGGVNIFDITKQEFFALRHTADSVDGLASDDVLVIHADTQGFVWAGTRDAGLQKIDEKSLQCQVFRHNIQDPESLNNDWVNALCQDKKGNLWVGTFGGGLSLFDHQQGKFTHYLNNLQDPRSLAGDRILSLWQDRSGTIWLGTYGNGISKLRLEESNFSHYYTIPGDPSSLSSNDVRSFLVDRSGQLWVGTDSRGLNLYDKNTQKFRHFFNDPADPTSISGNRIFSIIEDLSGKIWIGTYNGLNLYNSETGTFRRYQHSSDPLSLSDDRIRCLSLDKSGTIWIGTDGGGLNAFDPLSGTCKAYRYNPQNPFSLGNDRIFGLYCDPDNETIWVGTFGGGLSQFSKKEERFTRYAHDANNPNTISNNYIMPVIKSQTGIIWIGSNGGGLSRCDIKNNAFRSFSERDGLPNNTVYGIVEDEAGMLWLSTNKGICRFNPTNFQTKNYDVSDGLQSNEFNGGSYYKSPSGLFYFGGINGFNEFDPLLIKDNPIPPDIVLTDFQILNKSVPIGKMADGRTILKQALTETKELVLSHRDHTISFEFSALSFVASEKNQYAYMLEGFESDWNYSKNRHYITYTSLPPSTYTLRIKASNNDGIWNEKGLSLRLTITPPFWKTWWFIGLGSIFILLSAYSWYALRIRYLKRAKQALEILVEQRTQQLREVSLTDPLTGLRNRRFISEILSSDIRAFVSFKKFMQGASERRQAPIPELLVYGIYLFDIDHFKMVNDNYGHEAGDRVLQQFADILKNSVRHDDVVIRHGGEEFLVILKATDFLNVDIFAAMIKDKIANHVFKIDDQTTISRTCSIGYTIFPFFTLYPELISFEQTVGIADLGLYYAKEHGRNLAVYLEEAGKIPHTPDEIKNLCKSLPQAIEHGCINIKAL